MIMIVRCFWEAGYQVSQVADNSIGNLGCSALAKALPHLLALKHINLYCNCVFPLFAVAFWAACFTPQWCCFFSLQITTLVPLVVLPWQRLFRTWQRFKNFISLVREFVLSLSLLIEQRLLLNTHSIHTVIVFYYITGWCFVRLCMM